MSPMRAGQLREEVTFQSFTDVDDGAGGFDRTVVDGDTVRARVVRKVQTKQFEGGKIDSAILYEVTVRRKPTTDVLKGQLKFGTRTLEILGDERDERGEMTKLTCVEVPADE